MHQRTTAKEPYTYEKRRVYMMMIKKKGKKRHTYTNEKRPYTYEKRRIYMMMMKKKPKKETYIYV